jgi:hypothetical protein
MKERATLLGCVSSVWANPTLAFRRVLQSQIELAKTCRDLGSKVVANVGGLDRCQELAAVGLP